MYICFVNTANRRRYSNPGPNFAWHIDGYDKIKPWGFPVHGAIDGFSRKILWLKVVRSNNSPDNIASFFVSSVETYGGCPVELITDLGTENGLAASIQCFFRNNPDAHRYVPSPRNQRIEAWWSQLCKQRTSWWRMYFSNLESQRIYDPTLILHKEALWFSFSSILQEDLDFIKEHWNCHFIRQSRHGTIGGRPDILYNLPENFGAEDGIIQVLNEDIEYAKQHIINEEQVNIYKEYFEYVMENYPLEMPSNWEGAETLYKKLLDISVNEECLMFL